MRPWFFLQWWASTPSLSWPWECWCHRFIQLDELGTPGLPISFIYLIRWAQLPSQWALVNLSPKTSGIPYMAWDFRAMGAVHHSGSKGALSPCPALTRERHMCNWSEGVHVSFIVGLPWPDAKGMCAASAQLCMHSFSPATHVLSLKPCMHSSQLARLAAHDDIMMLLGFMTSFVPWAWSPCQRLVRIFVSGHSECKEFTVMWLFNDPKFKKGKVYCRMGFRC